MKIHESAIFKAHFEAGRAMNRRRKYAILGAFLLGVGCTGFLAFLVFVVTRRLVPEVLLSALFLGAIILGYVGGVIIVLAGKLIQSIRQDIEALATALDIKSEYLLDKGREILKSYGRVELLKRAVMLLSFREQKAEVLVPIYSTMPPLLRAVVEQAIENEDKAQVRAISGLYDALRKFDLVKQGGYGWVFDEARKSMTQK